MGFVGRSILFLVLFVFSVMALIIAVNEDISQIKISQQKGTISGLLVRNDLRTPLNTGVKKIEYVRGELIIKVKPNISLTSSKTSGIQGFLVSTGVDTTASQEIMPDVYKLKVNPKEDIEKLVKKYQSDRNILFAEPNYRYYVNLVPNDSSYDQQWAHQNSFAEFGWNVTTGNTSVVIAVIDTGVDWNHPDLAGNIWNNSDEISGNGLDDDNNGIIDDIHGYDFVETSSSCWPGEDCSIEDNDPMDFHGHGTHVSGIAGAVSNNSLGVSGVCWNCKMMPVRAGFALSTGQGVLETDDIVQAINYAVNNNASVISMSFGGTSGSASMQEAIDYAYSSGVVLIASAGNGNSQTKQYPSGWDNVFSVAAHDSSDNRASFSQYGSWVDISAPGVSIYSTTFDDAYVNSSGTSMSAPYISGVAGLILSRNSSLNPEEVYSILRSSREDVNSSLYIGTGKINVSKAVSYLNVVVTSLSSNLDDATLSDSNISLFGNVTGKLSNWTLFYGSGAYPNSWNKISSGTSEITNGSLGTLDSRILFNGRYVFRVSAYGSDGNIGEDRTYVTISNQYYEPLIVLESPGNGIFTSNESLTFGSNIYSNSSLVNVSLYGNWSGTWEVDQTNTSGATHVLYSFVKNLSNFSGTFVWGIRACYFGQCTMSSNRTFTRSNILVDLVSPANSTYSNQTNVTLEWNVTLSQGNNSFCDLNVDLSLTSSNVSSPAGVLVNQSVGNLSNGLHNWSVGCSDELNNSVSSTTRIFYVDNVAPEIVLYSPINGTNTNNESIIFNWTVSDAVDPSVTCNLTINGNSESVGAVNGTFNFVNKTGLLEGENVWNISCSDTAGNTNASTTWTLQVDRTAPQILIVAPLNNSLVTTSSVSALFNVTFNESVDSWYSLLGENTTLCSFCLSVLVNITFPHFGNNNLTIYAQDGAQNINSSFLNFSLVLDTDSDGNPDSNETDADNDGILDSSDGLIGSENNIVSNVMSLMLQINGSANSSQTFSETLPVLFRDGNDTLVSFDFDFNNSQLTTGNVVVKKFNESNTGKLLVSGLNLSSGLTKSVYLDRVNNATNFSSVCIKDSAIFSISEISSGCNSSYETLINCPGSFGRYSCTSVNNSLNISQWKITGLNNSGVIQTCTENWSCGDWGACDGSSQTRSCSDANSCGTIAYRPALSQSCSTSSGGGSSGSSSGGGGGGGSSSISTVKKNITENDTTPIAPSVNESCIDGILNQNETQVDCGGVCSSCGNESQEENILYPVHDILSQQPKTELEETSTSQTFLGLVIILILVFGIFAIKSFPVPHTKVVKNSRHHREIRKKVLS